jgi:hypothetical protein
MLVFRDDDGKLYIKDNSREYYENLSDNIPIIEENFEYFATRPSSLFRPDEFIRNISYLPNGSKIIADNLEFILTHMKNNGTKVRSALVGNADVSERVAKEFEKMFKLTVFENEDVEIDKSINPSKRYVESYSNSRKENFYNFFRYIKNLKNPSQVLEEHKDLFLNSNFNSSMAEMVKVLGTNPGCYEFIRNNFETIKSNCYVPNLAELYANIRESYPEEFAKEAFTIDNIYLPALEQGKLDKSVQINLTCSKIIDQGRTKDLETLTKFMMEHSTIEPETLKVLGVGWFNITLQAGDKAIKLDGQSDAKEKKEIPYHPRLLQPIKRKVDTSRDPEHPLAIEMYEVVDANVEISDEELLEVYKELREDGIRWLDVKKENLGRLRKPNYQYELGNNIPLPPKMLGIRDSGVGRKILPAGELVIIDLDFFDISEDKDNKTFVATAYVPACIREYEKEFVKKNKAKGEPQKKDNNLEAPTEH